MSTADERLGQYLAEAIAEAMTYGRAAEAIIAALTSTQTLVQQIEHAAELHPTLVPELKAAIDGVAVISEALSSAIQVVSAQYANALDKLNTAGEKSA